MSAETELSHTNDSTRSHVSDTSTTSYESVQSSDLSNAPSVTDTSRYSSSQEVTQVTHPQEVTRVTNPHEVTQVTHPQEVNSQDVNPQTRRSERVITLSDLECDYLNATACCSRINKWVLPEAVAQGILTVLLLFTGHWILFLLYVPCTAWLAYKIITKPSGDIGLYDPTEIHNRQQLKIYMRDNMIKMAFHLIFFFIYLYWMIYTLLKDDTTMFGHEAKRAELTDDPYETHEVLDEM
ncbi:hypothetical protein FSP39_022628 [Pinctada imbricata]|uniref:Uncharacterized protein n=1 Tax=Pinctada imbricata TaxID=66713 RepID=A0AA88XY64_PINIB|nr:hypothetical protein FSP39_022628 [Pinctada imbricata]